MQKTLYGVLLATTAGISPIWAQETPFEANAVYLGTLTLSTTNPEDVAISTDDLEQSNPGDLQDIFKAEPTISVGSSIPASQKIYVNGVEEVNLAVSIDGARQNNRIFHHSATTIIDPDLLKAVRVDPGVAPADAGPAALAGAIAWETKDVADLLADGDASGASANLEFDSNGSVWNRSASAYGRSGNFEVLGFMKWADGADNRVDGDGDDIPGSGTNLTSGLAKIAWEGQSGDRVEFSYEKVIDDTYRPYRANLADLTGRDQGERIYDIERQNIVLTYTDETPSGLWDPTIRVAYNETELTNAEEEQFTYGRTNSFNALLQNKFSLENGDVTVGFDYYRNEASLEYVDYSGTWDSQDLSETLINYGAFAQARLTPVDGLDVSLGMRADLQDFSAHDELGGFEDYDETVSGFSGNMSASYDLGDFITVSAGYSNVWGGIQLAENYIMHSGWAYSSDGFDTVRAKSKFLAAEIFAGDLAFDAKVFETTIKDARLASYRGGPNVTANLQSLGFEVGASYNWGAGFARLAYANIETEVNGDAADSYSGLYLTTPLGEEIVLQAAHSFDNLGLRVGGDVQWVLENAEVIDDGLVLPAYSVANIWADYTPAAMDNLIIRAEINNLFDETYAARATYGQEFDSVEPLYEPGRSFKISATYKF